MSAGRSSLTRRVRAMFPVTASGRIEVERVTPLAPMGVGVTTVNVETTSASRLVPSTRSSMRDPEGRGATDPLWADPY